MASCTFRRRLFCCRLVIRQGMMAEREETPAIGLGKALTVFYGQVDAVVRAVEESAPGWFLAGAVWESRIKDPREFFYDDRSFRKLTCLQIHINVFLLDVDVMV